MLAYIYTCNANGSCKHLQYSHANLMKDDTVKHCDTHGYIHERECLTIEFPRTYMILFYQRGILIIRIYTNVHSCKFSPVHV